jgi:hypothetical protein
VAEKYGTALPVAARAADCFKKSRRKVRDMARPLQEKERERCDVKS